MTRVASGPASTYGTGGDTWQSFRAASHDLLGRQSLDGDVVVLINRLAHPALPLAAAGVE